MSKRPKTQEDLADITRAVAQSIDHSDLTLHLERLGYNVGIDTTDFRNAGDFKFDVGGSFVDEPDGEGGVEVYLKVEQIVVGYHEIQIEDQLAMRKVQIYSVDDAEPAETPETPDEPEEGNLVKHARRELEILGEEPETIAQIVKVVEAWAAMGHSGGSHAVLLPVLTDLLNFQNLRPLTDSSDEWFFHEPARAGNDEGFWQNIRNGSAFSNDGGKTYWLTSDGSHDGHVERLYQSVKR